MKIGKLRKVRIITLVEDYAGYETTFYAQHAVSFLIEVENEVTKKRILFDTGQSAEPILHNMKILGIDPTTIDVIFLSHCHYDHTQGLVDMLKSIGKEIPVIAHPDIFRLVFTTQPFLKHVGMIKENTKANVEISGGKLVLIKEPFQIMDGVISTGEIKEKVEFEKEVSLITYTIKDGSVVKDDLHDEMSLALSTPDGLVLVVGCGHPGITSITNSAKNITGINEVEAVIGGFHLIEVGRERREKTVKHLKEMEARHIYTGHCTGLEAEAAFLKEFGERFEKLHSGKIIELS